MFNRFHDEHLGRNTLSPFLQAVMEKQKRSPHPPKGLAIRSGPEHNFTEHRTAC